MHQCQNYLKQLGFIDAIPAHFLNLNQANTARSYLFDDASGLLFTAAVSIADAIRGLRSGFYTWATVKLYYSVFYSARAALALKDVALIYKGTKPHTLKLLPGESLAKKSGTTHEVVLNAFCDSNPSSFYLSQTINQDKPLAWLRQKREEANYKSPKATEPNAPSHFQRIVSIGVGKTLSAYLSMHGPQYAFEPDHAMLSYPLLFWQDTLKEARSRSLPEISSDEIKFLKTAFQDDALRRIVEG